MEKRSEPNECERRIEISVGYTAAELLILRKITHEAMCGMRDPEEGDVLFGMLARVEGRMVELMELGAVAQASSSASGGSESEDSATLNGGE